MNCPFCNDNDFDLIGLKHHLLSGYCNIFNDTKTIFQESLERKEAKDNRDLLRNKKKIKEPSK